MHALAESRRVSRTPVHLILRAQSTLSVNSIRRKSEARLKEEQASTIGTNVRVRSRGLAI